METTSGIVIRIKGEFIMLSQTDAFGVKVMIAIPKNEWKLLNDQIEMYETGFNHKQG